MAEERKITDERKIPEESLDREIMRVVISSILDIARKIHHPTDDDTRIELVSKTFEEIVKNYPMFDDVIEDVESTYGKRGKFVVDLMLELKQLGSAHNDPNNIPGVKSAKEYNKLMHNPRNFARYVKEHRNRFPALDSFLSQAGYA